MPTCHSTNDIAAELCKKSKIKEGAIVVAANQISGRGQRGNKWETEPGKNITCSVLFEPEFLEPSLNFFLNIYSSLGILDYLSNLGLDFRIKWPNDIFYKNKKLCGILIENTVKGQSIGQSILGIGMNLNQMEFKVPGAISLGMIFSREFDIFNELEKMAIHIEKRYLQLKNREYEELTEKYLKNLFWINETHTFFDVDFFEGTIVGISAVGRLQIATETGIREYGFKEVRFIR